MLASDFLMMSFITTFQTNWFSMLVQYILELIHSKPWKLTWKLINFVAIQLFGPFGSIGDGNLVRRETSLIGARSFTDELALKMGRVSAPESLLQTQALDTSCELPSGGRWCTARSGGKEIAFKRSWA